jgi:diaminopimelate decarboxylase
LSVQAASTFRGFSVVADELSVGGQSLTALAARAGRTPFYVYDRASIAERVALLRAALPREIVLHYAIKANPMPALVGFMVSQVDGLDVASGGELRVALDAGMTPRQVSFAGPGKTTEELLQAVSAGILINLESLREIRLLEQISQRIGAPARVAVRVNPDFELKSSGMRMSGGPKQFGIDAEQVPDALADIQRRGLAFEGFHIYSGSQSLKSDAICEAQQRAVALAEQLGKHAPSPIRVLNLGGGFGIPYFKGELPLDLEPIGRNLHELLSRTRSSLPNAELVIELGRYLVGESGLYVCRILDRKVSREEIFLVTDGGLHHHLAASGNFGQVIRKNYPIAIGNRIHGSQREIASVVGPLCTPLDLLGDKADLAVAREGDLVVVFQSGAYGFSASPHAFLGHPPPVEILV